MKTIQEPIAPRALPAWAMLSVRVLLLALLISPSNFVTAAPLVAPFTYQGRLQITNSPANGSYDFQFAIFDAANGGLQLGSTITQPGLDVNNGFFTTTLDFGPGVFDGKARWLDIAVRTNGAAAFTTLAPRQPLTAVPYAMFAPNAGVATSANGVAAASVSVAGLNTASVDARYVLKGSDVMTGPLTTPNLTVPGVITTPSLSGSNSLSISSGSNIQFRIDQANRSTNSVFEVLNGTGNRVLQVDEAGNSRIYGNQVVDSNLTVRGNLVVSGGLSNATPVLRYVPITVGDLGGGSSFNTGDSMPGALFIAGQESGGSITFPMPPDYSSGTTFALDLYITPITVGFGNVNFFVRWTGFSSGSFSDTGPSRTTNAVAVGTAGYILKQSFTLPAFSGKLPELVNLTIRRQASDTYIGPVVLTGLRLSYQAIR
jgi:hypothetical protein